MATRTKAAQKATTEPVTDRITAAEAQVNSHPFKIAAQGEDPAMLAANIKAIQAKAAERAPKVTAPASATVHLPYDPKAKNDVKVACKDCGKTIFRADSAPTHSCFKCLTARQAQKAAIATADAVEAANIEKAAPKARKAGQNPRVLANRMVTTRAKAIADRSKADA